MLLLTIVKMACLRLALACGDEDALIRLPGNFKVDPSLVPLDGDGFASWLTKQDKVKACTVTPAMQQKYAKEIRAAKLEEFKSYLDNDAIRLTDRRELGRDDNFLTGHWVLPVKVDKNGYFSKFKARWVCLGPADRQPYRYSVWFPFGCSVCCQPLLGPFSTSISRPPFFRGTLQSVTPIGCCSVASGHWLATLDGRSLPSSGLWSERCTSEMVEQVG